MTRRSGNDHRAGPFIGEDFGQQRVAIGAADDVRTVNAAPQQRRDVLKFGNHAACRGPAADELIGFGGRQARQFRLRVAG